MSITMNIEQWGPVDDPYAPRALLVHGITSSAETMWELGEGLAMAGWAVHAVDLPGHGGSPAAESYRFADVADTIATRCGGGYELLVGHSLGGAVGTVLLARHPETALRAVLIDPALDMAADDVAGLPDRLLADKGLGLDDVAAEHPSWHPRTVLARVRGTAAADVDAVRGWVRDNQPWDVTADVARVTVPVLVLVATDGSTAAPGLPDRLRALNPHWTFETVPDSTHSIHRDHPDLVLVRLLG